MVINYVSDVITACGIELSILIARYHELQHSIFTIKEEKIIMIWLLENFVAFIVNCGFVLKA
ncbi:hypothetical protein [Bartonella sp. OT172YNZD]|uniref:hypothetical protein n=1 Tax=Bartonella sp. OT172YNZD TaxID=3243572 RepID=UPI0035D109DD